MQIAKHPQASRTAPLDLSFAESGRRRDAIPKFGAAPSKVLSARGPTFGSAGDSRLSNRTRQPPCYREFDAVRPANQILILTSSSIEVGVLDPTIYRFTYGGRTHARLRIHVLFVQLASVSHTACMINSGRPSPIAFTHRMSVMSWLN